MDRAISLEARRIDLAIESPFHLGPARIDPAAHEIGWKGNVRRLQPQTMKVLVALHDKLGQVVTRDELVDRCWDGRFVGEDVINRCISLLRRVAAESGGIEIQTVPRGGYRLVGPQADERGKDGSTDARRFHPLSPLGARQRGVGIATAMSILVVVGIGSFVLGRSQPTSDAVMLKPFDVAGSAPLARTLAAGVSADVGTALSAAGVDVVDSDAPGRASGAGFVLSGRAELPDSDLHLTAQLEDARDHTVLWSTSFTRPAAQMQAMQEQVAANVAAVLHCAIDTSRDPSGEALDQDSIKLYLKACALQQAVDPPSDQIQDLLKQVTAREPRFADGWARLALFAANAAFTAPPLDADRLRSLARLAVANALRLDPKSGTAYDAVAEMKLGHVPFAELHSGFQKVLSFAPDDVFTIADECELLLRMGSIDASLRMCRRGAELAPLSPEEAADLVTALVDESQNGEAQATLRHALRIWPDDKRLKFIHLDYEARFGDPDRALAIINDNSERPQLRDVSFEIYRRLIAARKSGQPSETRAFTRWLESTAVSEQEDAGFVAPMLARFGDVDGAFKLALAAPTRIPEDAPDPAFLWDPDSRSLRRDPRFIALAARSRVADFWRTTGLWPDFCSAPDLPYDCKAEEVRLLSGRPRLDTARGRRT